MQKCFKIGVNFVKFSINYHSGKHLFCGSVCVPLNTFQDREPCIHSVQRLSSPLSLTNPYFLANSLPVGLSIPPLFRKLSISGRKISWVPPDGIQQGFTCLQRIRVRKVFQMLRSRWSPAIISNFLPMRSNSRAFRTNASKQKKLFILHHVKK